MRQDPPADPLWAAGVRDALLRHFAAHARPLPWRATADPYAVLVSEVMLQQTRVTAVVPYYEQWLRRFPDIAALADAPLDDVLKAWEGLGYYTRARNLHRTARIVRERHAGTLPADYAALRALPGIGDYTAGAVASIAFGMRRSAVDGNVRRVVARLLDEPAPAPARLRGLADALVADGRPGDVNQALMELGATICTPRAPRCGACPVARFCAAQAAGTQQERPRRRRATVPPLFHVATAAIHTRDGRVLLTRRAAAGLLAGMWCLPGREIAEPGTAPATVLDIARDLLGDVPVSAPVEVGTLDHTFSHRRERYWCWRIDLEDHAEGSGANVRWAGADLTRFALPAAQRRLLGLVAGACP